MNLRIQWGMVVSAAFAVGVWAPLSVMAQQPVVAVAAVPVIKRTVLNRVDVPDSKYEVVYALVEIAANSAVPRHTHPGTVFGYLLEGDYTILIAGHPPRALRIGETLEVPARVVHEERTGKKAVKLMVVFTVEKGKPLSSPAP